MATNPQARVLELLKRFNDGKQVGVDTLKNDSMWYGKSEKTIRRDLDVIKEYFPDSFELVRGGKGEKGTYKAITKELFNNLIDKDTLALMVQTIMSPFVKTNIRFLFIPPLMLPQVTHF